MHGDNHGSCFVVESSVRDCHSRSKVWKGEFKCGAIHVVESVFRDSSSDVCVWVIMQEAWSYLSCEKAVIKALGCLKIGCIDGIVYHH